MNKDQTQPKKPLAIVHNETENELFNAVSIAAQNLPFYLLEGILTNILHQVREKANAERDKALQLYKKQLSEYERDCSEKNIENVPKDTQTN